MRAHGGAPERKGSAVKVSEGSLREDVAAGAPLRTFLAGAASPISPAATRTNPVMLDERELMHEKKDAAGAPLRTFLAGAASPISPAATRTNPVMLDERELMHEKEDAAGAPLRTFLAGAAPQSALQRQE